MGNHHSTMKYERFKDETVKAKRTTSRPQRSNSHDSSEPLTPSVSRQKKEWYLSGRSRSKEDTSDEEFQIRLEEIAKECHSRGIGGRGITITSKSLADQINKASINSNAPGIPENQHKWHTCDKRTQV